MVGFLQQGSLVDVSAEAEEDALVEEWVAVGHNSSVRFLLQQYGGTPPAGQLGGRVGGGGGGRVGGGVGGGGT
uniref:Uncharacterized protein n=1 Tax=Anopheles epiroticus TaxID=199890 RepID=A0A182PV26_9DIPT